MSWYITTKRRRGPVFPAASSVGLWPGDIVSGATAWFGLRTYNAAYATGSNPCIDIVKTSDGTAPMTINILSTGALDVATIAGLGYGVSVNKWYDQTGNGNHVIETTLSEMPTVTLSAINGKPALLFVKLELRGLLKSGFTSLPQPFTTSAVYTRDSSNTGTFRPIITGAGNGIFSGDTAGGVLTITAGTAVNISSVANDVPHAVNVLFNGASSAAKIDGTDNTGLDFGAGSFGTPLGVGTDGFGSFMNGFIGEAGVWPTGFDATQRANLDANQQAYWGI